MQLHVLGIEIGGTKLQMVAGDSRGRILETRRFTVERSAGARGIRRAVESALPDLLHRWQPKAIGVGFGGPVDTRSGRIARSHQIEGWSGFNLRTWLGKQSGLPVWAENDANTAALAEATHGAGKGRNPVFYVTLGSGVGGGCVVDGRIYHGNAPGESEIGHLRLDRRGTLVEQRCSGWAVDARIRRLGSNTLPTCLRGWLPAHPGGEARLLPRALRAGDKVAHGILNGTADDLAFALSHVTHLFHPEVVVLGGGLSLIGAPLRLAVARALPAYVMEVFHGGPVIRLAKLGEQAVPIGALLGALDLLAGGKGRCAQPARQRANPPASALQATARHARVSRKP